MRGIHILLAVLPLTACAAVGGNPPIQLSFGGPALISGHSPPNAVSANSEPQSVNSLPPGFEGVGQSPNARFPNYGSVTLPL